MKTAAKERTRVEAMFDSIAARYDLANTVLSFGIHHLWRRKGLSMLRDDREGAVLDLCTGTGDMLPHLAKKYGQVTGADFSRQMLSLAEVRSRGRETISGEPIRIRSADALDLPFEEDSFDSCTIVFGVRNFQDTAAGLKEVQRVLKSNGSLMVIEFGQPDGIIFGPLYRFYSRFIMPILGGLVTGNKEAYTYLPETAKDFPSGEGFAALAEEVGFTTIKTAPLTFGIAWIYLFQK